MTYKSEDYKNGIIVVFYYHEFNNVAFNKKLLFDRFWFVSGFSIVFESIETKCYCVRYI